MAAQTETREQEIRKIWADHRLFYKLLGAALLIGIGALLGRLIYAAPEADQAWSYGVNIYTSIISTLVTVFILDQLAERRADRKAEETLKRQLVDDAASTSNEIAKNAVHQLQRKGWLTTTTALLLGADLSGANLAGAKLVGAHLEHAELFGANLRGAQLSFANIQRAELSEADLSGAEIYNAGLERSDMSNANLQGAKLRKAQLQGVRLENANLQGADIRVVNFEGANLCWTKLQGADMRSANLRGALLDEAELDEQTRLPDTTYWTPETDMARFTDPNHPNFWRSDWHHSPAYRGKDTSPQN